MMARIALTLLTLICFSSLSNASEQTYIREYTYQASEADSKISARAIALQEVKLQLLNELGTHVSSLVRQQTTSDGNSLSSIQVETLSAGVVSLVILDEKWNGLTYCWRWSITAHKRRTNTAIGNNDRPLKRGHTAP
jgi:hypothetical protein